MHRPRRARVRGSSRFILTRATGTASLRLENVEGWVGRLADRRDIEFTYSLIDRIFRLSLGEMADFSGRPSSTATSRSPSRRRSDRPPPGGPPRRDRPGFLPSGRDQVVGSAARHFDLVSATSGRLDYIDRELHPAGEPGRQRPVRQQRRPVGERRGRPARSRALLLPAGGRPGERLELRALTRRAPARRPDRSR